MINTSPGGLITLFVGLEQSSDSFSVISLYATGLKNLSLIWWSGHDYE